MGSRQRGNDGNNLVVALICHPESGAGPVRGINVHLRRAPGGTLAMTYTIEADLARVRVPAPRPPRIAHGLWQRTCCECFIALGGEPRYHEFNFAPSGEWAAYAFATYREGEALVDEALNPGIVVRRPGEGLALDATIPLERLSASHARERLSLALSAVIEDEAGSLSYWALRHPADKPDFHHPDSFALELENQARRNKVSTADTRR
jgi:hypothetical protein